MGERSKEYDDGFWRQDENGWYLPVNNQGSKSILRPDNTSIFLHEEPHRELDHIFHVVSYNEDDTGNCLYVWRDSFDFFDILVREMIERDFSFNYSDEPDEGDIAKYEEHTGRPYSTIDSVVKLALEHFDEEWDFMQDEDGWHP